MTGRTFRVSQETYDQLLRESGGSGVIAQQKDPITPNGCTKIITIGLDDEGRPFGNEDCGGDCGLWNRFLGRSCSVAGETTADGVQTYCVCSGGWFDRLFK